MDFYTLDQLLKLKLVEPPPIIADGVLPRGCKMIVFGDPKKGKSVFLSQMAWDIALGNKWMGFKTVKNTVLYNNYEMPLIKWKKRFEKRQKATGLASVTNLITGTDLMAPALNSPAGMAQLERDIAALKPSVVILDSIYKVFDGSMNEEEKLMPLFNFFDVLIATYDVSIVVCHHSRKQKGDSHGVYDFGAQEASGAYCLIKWPDSIIRFNALPPEGSGKARLTFDCRHPEDDLKPIHIQLDRNEVGFKVV